MLPSAYGDDLINDYEIISQPTKTYKLNFAGQPSPGFISGLEAMEQAIFLILHTERFTYEIYSWNYGIELADKFGEANIPLLQTNLKLAISEALMADDRILKVDEFSFERNKSNLYITFLVETTEGAVASELNWQNGVIQ